MVARRDNLFSGEWSKRTYFDLLDKATLKLHPGGSLFRFKVKRKTVRSVQRLPLPEGRNADWVKSQYVEWLPRFLAPAIRVNTAGPTVMFSMFTERPVLLQLNLHAERSDGDRQLMYIVDGLLVAKANQGRLEFRVVLNRRYVLSAIHDFKPALPWFIYQHTQARLHLFVMRAFGRYLAQSK